MPETLVTVAYLGAGLLFGGKTVRDERKRLQFTDEGEALASRIVTRHRLIEAFLVQVFGIPWDEVHEEAERLFEVFAVSDHGAPTLLEALDADASRASEQIARCRALAAAAHALLTEPPPTPPGEIRDVA